MQRSASSTGTTQSRPYSARAGKGVVSANAERVHNADGLAGSPQKNLTFLISNPSAPPISMPRFRKKLVVVVEAVQFDGKISSVESLNIPAYSQVLGSDTLQIYTLKGEMTAQPGDWVIKGVRGEFYPCKPELFEATYEPA